jgi:hypothetical protein
MRARNKTDSNKEERSKTIPICRLHDPIPKRPYNSTKKLLEIINTFGKVTGYKINIQKSVAFHYTNNTQTKKETKETIPFTIASKTIKYLGINLMKEIKDLFNENHKPLKREIEEGIRRWKDLPSSGSSNLVDQ